jgi:signal transduction histidine kinase
LNVARVTISLFDQRWQYVIAEATPRLTLAPSAKTADGEGLLLCGTAVPRSQSICSQVVKRTLEGAQILGGDDLPLYVINDVSPQFVENSYFSNWPHSFYAAVPIQTSRGIDIGSLGIYGDQPSIELDEVAVALMQDISRTIMEYLSAVRAREGQRRADRMVRGVGSFVEGEASLSGWRDSTNTESFQDSALLAEGALNVKQQNIQQHQQSSSEAPSNITKDDTTQDEGQEDQGEVDKAQPVSPHNKRSPATDTDTDSESNSAKHTFSKAANILRESMEVEGVLFLDASISSFGGGIRRGNSRHGSSSSSDDSQNSTNLKDPDIPCSALGFSNSSESSIDGSLKSHGRESISEKLLGKFIKKYPKGNIFNYDENGTLSSSESASEDNTSNTRKFLYSGDHASDGRTRPSIIRKDSSFQKTGAAALITQLFPGARSVAFIPVWDSHKQRWFSGGFIYTKSPSRTFTTEGELSYFSAFSSIVMAEIHRGREAKTNQSKTDLLGSLSHELRSPLHGVVLGAELLQDTDLDIFQKDVLNTIENCCRTIVGTIDHLLDWTKINKFKQSSAVEMQNGRPPRRRGTSDGIKMSIETGMMTTTSQVDIAAIAEQVVESIFAGHTFQTMSVMRMMEGSGSADTMTDAVRALDGMEALENMTTRPKGDSGFQIVFGGVVVTLSIDPHVSWAFATQPGALRRILMNLIGNSLRFTNQGFVEIRMGQESLRGRHSNSRLVVITVTDTGRGIGQDFLKHQLFKPFAQEDALGAGAGLGLSLVKNITTSLHGTITAESEPGEGCTMTVKLPLRVASLSNAEMDETEEDFSANITELQGLRVAITGYPSSSDRSFKDKVKEGLLRERSTLVEVCNNWLRMHVVEPHMTAEFIPDLILCGERSFEQSLKELRADQMTPTVVICRNALVARRMATSPKYSIRACNGVIDFISQP